MHKALALTSFEKLTTTLSPRFPGLESLPITPLVRLAVIFSAY
jgi:hypothetical protein